MRLNEIKSWILTQYKAMGATRLDLIKEWWMLRDVKYIVECLDLLGFDNIMDDCRDSN